MIGDGSPLSGHRVLVTGSGGGIGAATARALVERGALVAIYDADTDAAERTARALGEASQLSLLNFI